MTDEPKSKRPPALDEADRKTLGAEIRRRRKELGLTAIEVAEAAGVTQPAIAKIEAGTNAPALAILLALRQPLQCSLVDLVAVLDGPRQQTAKKSRRRVDGG